LSWNTGLIAVRGNIIHIALRNLTEVEWKSRSPKLNVRPRELMWRQKYD
jgi:hypothetical protein